MTLAISATGNGDGTVDLTVSDAAHVGETVYASDFSEGTDDWFGGTLDGSYEAPDPYTTFISGQGVLVCSDVNDMVNSNQYVARIVLDLTIGLTYRIYVNARSGSIYRITSTGVRVGIDGAYGPVVAVGDVGSTALHYDFEATATAHEIRVRVQGYDEGGNPQPNLKLIAVSMVGIDSGLEELQIQRTDANGTHLVRLYEGMAPNVSGDFSVEDNEAALVGAVTYVVRDGLGNTAADVLYASRADDTNEVWDAATHQAWSVLSQVGLSGQSNVAVPVFQDYDGARTYQELTRDVKAIIGREDFTSVTTGDYGWTKRQGRLRYLCVVPANDQIGAAQNQSNLSLEIAQAIVDLYGSGRVALLRQTSYLRAVFDVYHVAKSVRMLPDQEVASNQHQLMALEQAGYQRTGRIWAVEIDYVEVGWPEGDLIGIAWTYGDLTTAYLAYWNIPDAFPTYADLTAGIPS